MKRLFLAAIAVLALGAGAANAQSMTHQYPASSPNQSNWMAGGGG